MKRMKLSIITAAALTMASLQAGAEPLEIGLALTPTFVQDDAYEAFSEGDLAATRFGLDLRSEILHIRGFRIVPFVAYRTAFDDGNPYGVVKTEVAMRDFLAGIRVRKGLATWLFVFAEASGGLLWVDMSGKGQSNSLDVKERYWDDQTTWSVGGLAGLETRISRNWLRSRGVRWFNFGVELGAGYVRRGDMTFDPELESGEEYDLPTESSGSWGEVNLSGWLIQIGACFKFF